MVLDPSPPPLVPMCVPWRHIGMTMTMTMTPMCIPFLLEGAHIGDIVIVIVIGFYHATSTKTCKIDILTRVK